MRKIQIMTFLFLINCANTAYCQRAGFYADMPNENEKYSNLTGTEKMFNIDGIVNIEDFVYFKNGKMILEMRDVHDYENLKNLDSVLMQFRKDIAFYKDSLENGIGNVRIDYRIDLTKNTGSDNRMIRFIKYNTAGDMYVKRNGDIERLKIEQDTIRLLFQVTGHQDILNATTHSFGRLIYPIQVTFVLDNFTDIDKIISEKDVILHALDTLPRTRDRNETNFPWRYNSSCIYKPYFSGSAGSHYLDSVTGKNISDKIHFVKFPFILKDEYGQFTMYSFQMSQHTFGFYGNIGAGLVRNTLAPNADIGLSHYHYRSGNEPNKFNFTSLYMSPFFFFSPNNNGFYTNDNWFINIESGNTTDNQILGVKLRGFSVGAGYLAFQKGDYFTGATVKVFASLPLLNGITISPELIATDNFKQIFPGLNLKVFGIKQMQ